MTKNKFNHYFDKIFWYGVALIPLLLLVIFAIRNPSNSLADLLTQFVSQFPTGDLVSNIFTQIWVIISGLESFVLGANIPSVIIYLCSYLVYAEILHLLVDFLLFIPHMAHKFMSCLTKE